MKNISIFYSFLLLFSVFFVFSFSQERSLQYIFREGNEAYQKQQFETAIQLYQQILSRGYQSKEIYYNLGNSFYRLNRIGESVLYYEKALKLDPSDADVQHNLELARLRVIDRVEMPQKLFLFVWWDTLKYLFSLGQLTRLVVTLFSLGILSLILWIFIKSYRIRQWILSLSVTMLILTLLWSYILFIRVQEFEDRRRAVILSPTVSVMSAPDENSTDVFLLHEGVKVQLDDVRDQWVKISLPDGKSGWMKSNNLGII
jgi:tetratricopeptide (TPR) repeat protein